ncbi:hypothetical protein GN244_ATG08456 [Phytophthora infestans]|uniref:Uncharacterized protein n=1 Tax=Phytophthora infestans TaxID=4787 RepID=A0A833SV84_PHYIN|nr:hypothetical protein GN244_ATG08456 [Phytophthora infestans]
MCLGRGPTKKLATVAVWKYKASSCSFPLLLAIKKEADNLRTCVGERSARPCVEGISSLHWLEAWPPSSKPKIRVSDSTAQLWIVRLSDLPLETHPSRTRNESIGMAEDRPLWVEC